MSGRLRGCLWLVEWQSWQGSDFKCRPFLLLWSLSSNLHQQLAHVYLSTESQHPLYTDMFSFSSWMDQFTDVQRAQSHYFTPQLVCCQHHEIIDNFSFKLMFHEWSLAKDDGRGPGAGKAQAGHLFLVPFVHVASEHRALDSTLCPSTRSSPASVHPCIHLTTFHPPTCEQNMCLPTEALE